MIIYTIATNEGNYTSEEGHEQYVPALVKRYEQEITRWMAHNYPGIEFETRFAPEEKIQALDGEDDVVMELNEFISRNWTDWFPAEAYS